MTRSTWPVRVRRFALGLTAAAVHWGGAWGPPHAAGWSPQEGRAPQTPAAALRGETGAVSLRDPFLPVPEPAVEPRRAAERARGLAGLRAGEMQVVGIVMTTDARLAVLEALDGRTFVTRVNDRLADAIVSEVARDSVLFTLSPADGGEGAGPGREMRKTLGVRSVGP